MAIMNGLPFAAGCICADGHYEPVCHADLCHADKGDCGCPCCAHHSCCKGDLACCRQRTAPKTQRKRFVRATPRHRQCRSTLETGSPRPRVPCHLRRREALALPWQSETLDNFYGRNAPIANFVEHDVCGKRIAGSARHFCARDCHGSSAVRPQPPRDRPGQRPS